MAAATTAAPGLDAEIGALQARRAALRRELAARAGPLVAPSTAQQRTYRACAGVTAFRARDPDPAAPGGGAVLGLRVESMARGARFARPYYVLLHRAAGAPGRLRVRSHTVPPCIPLAGLAARHLPAAGGEGRAQDLAGFARALRRAIVRYRLRVRVVAALREQAGLGGQGGDEGGGATETEGAGEKSQDGRGILAAGSIRNICAADAEVRQVTIEWEDGRTGRLVLDDEGEVVRLVVFDEEGARDLATARKILTAKTG